MPDPQQSSPVQTGVAALSGGAIGPVVVWLCQVAHLTPPPDAVAATIGALLIMGAHFLANRLPQKITQTQQNPAPK
jgi:hypothetical protein